MFLFSFFVWYIFIHISPIGTDTSKPLTFNKTVYTGRRNFLTYKQTFSFIVYCLIGKDDKYKFELMYAKHFSITYLYTFIVNMKFKNWFVITNLTFFSKISST